MFICLSNFFQIPSINNKIILTSFLNYLQIEPQKMCKKLKRHQWRSLICNCQMRLMNCCERIFFCYFFVFVCVLNSIAGTVENGRKSAYFCHRQNIFRSKGGLHRKIVNIFAKNKILFNILPLSRVQVDFGIATIFHSFHGFLFHFNCEFFAF